jgi:hypothetical protein
MAKIPAFAYISLSELQYVNPSVTEQWVKENPFALLEALYELGLDTRQPFEAQPSFDTESGKKVQIFHRNKLNKQVSCTRWVGLEREDQAWLKSGFASKEALDRARNNKLLEDMYTLKGYVE